MSYPYSQSGLGADDFYGPPRPGQTDQAYQAQMSPVLAAVGIGALSLAINPLVGAVAGVAWLLSRPTGAPARNRFPVDERKGGH